MQQEDHNQLSDLSKDLLGAESAGMASESAHPFLMISSNIGGNLTKSFGAVFNLYNTTKKAKNRVQELKAKVERMETQIREATGEKQQGQRLDKKR